jgi:probable blue pigment (indigoidine) exporter
MKRDRRVGAALATLLAPISWGTTYVTVTELLPSGRPLLVAALRVLPAGALLVGVGWWRSRWWPDPADWRRLALLAICNFGVFFPLLIVAIYRLPGGVAASVGGVQPLLVGVITWAATGRSMRRLDIVIGVLAASGVAMVVIRPGASIDPVGVFAALGANVSFSAGVVATKQLPTFADRFASTGYQMLLATALLIPIMLFAEGPPPEITVVNIVGFAYLSIVATGVAFVIWFAGIGRLPPQAPPVLGLAAPLTGAALGWLLLGEDLTIIQVLGFATTVTAISYTATFGSTELEVASRSHGMPATHR